MKIALISPKGKFFESYKEYKDVWMGISKDSLYRKFHSGFGLALLTIAALTPKSFKIKLIDENFDSIDFNEKFDLIGLTGMTQQALRAYEIADEFRKRGIRVVIGGIHATVLPEEAKEHVDSVIIGEGEELWPKFLDDFKRGNIKPFYKTSNLTDLSKSPVPRYDLLNPKNYNVVWIQATRGCPHDCDFCAASKIYGFKFRHKKVGQVIEEIKAMLKIWGRGILVSFTDDNMFVDRKYSVELVEKLIPLKIRWFAQTDVSVARDENFLKLLRKSGCAFLFIGFETLSKEGLTFIDRTNWKVKQLSFYKQAVNAIQSNGMGVFGAFMLGLDSDSLSIFDKVIDFIDENNLYASQITILTPLPGTRLRERLKKEKRLLSKNWDDYTFLKATFTPNLMTAKELEEGLFKVYRGIYNRRMNIKRAKYFKTIYANLTK
ncbi:MAG: radical SAM protein [Candidatus Omnitrophota bacterium]